MKTHYDAYVGNIGCIGEFTTKEAAIAAIRETIENSGRADPNGFVCRCDNGDIVAEIDVSRGNHD